jgi:hypothetical protein
MHKSWRFTAKEVQYSLNFRQRRKMHYSFLAFVCLSPICGFQTVLKETGTSPGWKETREVKE